MSEAVRRFLLEFKQAATSGSGIDLVPRQGVKETLEWLGLTKRDVEQILLGLSVTDFCNGPLPDKDKPGELWEFGKQIEGQDVYIKLKVAGVAGVKIAKCISFHIAKHPLKYPHRK